MVKGRDLVSMSGRYTVHGSWEAILARSWAREEDSKDHSVHGTKGYSGGHSG